MIAAAVIILTPLAIEDWLRKNKTAVFTSLTITAALVIFILSTGSTPKTAAVSTIAMTDVSDIYRTGNMRTSTEWIVIHHTAGSPNCTHEDIARIHIGERGWSTIGYHYFIDERGIIYKLHKDGEVAPHSFRYNNNSVAICLSGNFVNHKPSAAQWASLKKLTKFLMSKYHLTTDRIRGHKQVNNDTECPGSLDLELLKKEVLL